ncbi:BON domain-containing protein [Noviluteimonas gilva]|nr:BON domain-containing protein [Lysobacter gilvus]
MNHKDRDRDHRYARSLRDTYNPEPQWLRQDRENRTWGSQRDEEFESGIGGSQYGGSEYGYGGSGRGSYAGSGREWGENAQGYNAQGYNTQSYNTQGAGTNRDFGGRDYGQRDQQRMREEREYQQRSFGSGRNAPSREAQQDDRPGYETSGWDDNLETGQRRYEPFHVGTGMGLGTDSQYGREREFGQSYGHASGYGGHGGWDLGTHQRDIGGSSSRQSFRGMGPSHYKRADERIRDDIYERLTDSHVIDARSITVDVNEGNVTLTGTVNERRMRYAAEDLVERVGGVANINNQLRVQAQETTLQQPSSSIEKTKLDDKRH